MTHISIQKHNYCTDQSNSEARGQSMIQLTDNLATLPCVVLLISTILSSILLDYVYHVISYCFSKLIHSLYKTRASSASSSYILYSVCHHHHHHHHHHYRYHHTEYMYYHNSTKLHFILAKVMVTIIFKFSLTA